jgi:hypothetical protein
MSAEGDGPIEQREWPTELLARAVSSDARERQLCGYDVERDLAKHYAFSDTILLALTGELPDEARSRAFAAVLTFASAMAVAEAPIHASVVARLCGVRTGGVLAIGAIALGEHGDALLRAIGSALDSGSPTELPENMRSVDAFERASVERLREAIGVSFDVPALRLDPSRDVAVVAVLRACGLETSFQLGAALSIARMPSVFAESVATKPGDFKNYPMDTPHFEYDPTKPAQSGLR